MCLDSRRSSGTSSVWPFGSRFMMPRRAACCRAPDRRTKAVLAEACARLRQRGVDLLEGPLRGEQLVPLVPGALELAGRVVALARDLREGRPQPRPVGGAGAQLLREPLHLALALGTQPRLLVRP